MKLNYTDQVRFNLQELNQTLLKKKDFFISSPMKFAKRELH